MSELKTIQDLKLYHRMSGFTLLEMLVVIFVMVILTAVVITFSRIGERRVLLLREQSKLIGAISRAKSMAMGMYAKETLPCAYGIEFIPKENSFILYQDLADDCKDSDFRYSGSSELVKKYQLDFRVRFKSLTLDSVNFIPPEPKTKIVPDQIEAVVILEDLAHQDTVTIKINRAGQITPE